MDAIAQGLAQSPGASSAGRRAAGWASRHAFLLLAALIWLTPGIIGLATRYWTTPQGAQGPIILATGIWAVLFEYGRNRALAGPGSATVTTAWLAIAVPGYVFGRMAGILSLECLAAYAGLVAVLYAYAGGRLVRRLWLPLVYLLCVIPLPYFVEVGLTGTLKVHIAQWAVELLSALGFDVAGSGSSLFIDQYELLVEAACSGLNSIFSLTAIGLFYIYWQRRGKWGKAVILTALIVPIAVLANFARVVLLLLLVHVAGDRVLATAIHPVVGLLMFVIALALLVAADRSWSRPAARDGKVAA